MLRTKHKVSRCWNTRVGANRQPAPHQQLDLQHLAALLAHEFSSPIAALRASSELLLDDISLDEQKEIARYLARQIDGLDRLTRDVVDAIRISPPGSDPFEAVDLAAVATEVVHDLQLGQGVRQPIDASGTADAWAKRGCVRAIVRNLIGNAAKYSPDSSGILVEIGVQAERACITVRDAGAGIDAELRERIFEPFYRGPSTARRVEGHGLGLYIARQLARLCNGEIYVESEPERGSAFTLVLPRAVVEAV